MWRRVVWWDCTDVWDKFAASVFKGCNNESDRRFLWNVGASVVKAHCCEMSAHFPRLHGVTDLRTRTLMKPKRDAQVFFIFILFYFFYLWVYFRSKPLPHSGFVPSSKNAISLFLTLFFDVIFLYFLRNFLVQHFLYRLFSVRYPLLLALLCSDVVRNVVMLGGKLYSDLNLFSFFFFFLFFCWGGGGCCIYLPIVVCQTLCSPVGLLFLLCD